MTDSLDDMHREMMERRRMVALLDVQLREYYTRRAGLQTEIVATFPHREVDIEMRRHPPFIAVTAWTRDGAADRVSLFSELDRLAETFGPIISERRNLAIEADTIARAIERMAEHAARRAVETAKKVTRPTERRQHQFEF